MSEPGASDDGSDAADAGSSEDGPVAGESRLLRALTKRFFILSMLVGLITIFCYAYNQFELPRIWDDGYIFQRYAQQLLAGAGLAWNPGSEPTYGLTSPLFVIPHALFRVLSGGNPSLGAALSSAVFGVSGPPCSTRLTAPRRASARPPANSGCSSIPSPIS